MRWVMVALVVVLACGDDDGGADAATDAPRADAPGVDAPGVDAPGMDAPGADAPGFDAGPIELGCAALPPSEGTEVRIGPGDADELPQIVRDASPGTVILLEDGTYTIGPDGEGNRRLQFHTANVTLRSVSNDANAVVLDGEYRTNEMIFIDADDVTIAHITITHAVDHGIHVTAPSGGPSIRGTVLYGLRLLDNGEQFVKVNANGDRTGWADEGRLECSFFRLTDEGRPNIEPNPGGCYTGGIDTHGGRSWVIRQNRFEDIYCTTGGLAEHAIHFWSASRDTLVEHNVIVNCARGIGFGLVEDGSDRPYSDDPYPGVGYIGHYDGIIRGNAIVANIPWYDTGVELAQARGARVYHNTVVSNDDATGFFSSIDYRFANTDVTIRNNIVRRITNRNGASGTVDTNLEGAGFSLFEDAPGGDVHLLASASDAIDQGVAVDEAGVDIDGETRDEGAPDLGADERR